MKGYIGRSMSEHAVSAYGRGESPLSGWTRDRLERLLMDAGWGYGELMDVPLTVLQAVFLRRTAWHHTGSNYHPTLFWEADTETITAHDADALQAAAERHAKPETGDPPASMLPRRRHRSRAYRRRHHC